MKVPFLDLHIVRGKNVATDEELKELEKLLRKQSETNCIRNKVTSNLLHELITLKGLPKRDIRQRK